jgi:hypothetical protein
MNNININIQNAAKNMIVGSKQHSLFASVAYNNPPLLTSVCEMPSPTMTQADETGENQEIPEIRVKSININSGNRFLDIRKATSLVGSNMNCGLNQHLYGSMLTLCNKQFMS